ncbi:hypothetical protein RJ640_007505 [Escallonia rubra]|uniref:Uncharacterized protein n=1 Tax=Escallonia rubra TaxID=112253 RepID=A0AA88QVQ5_9ASTE|nr:hypothetical protein RJ640_007505 [Escallonia rubra]
MEALRKLEQVQSTISLMQFRGVIDSSDNNNTTNADSNRFLANFTLLLVQPCGKLEMDTKCQLISEHLSKISAAFLEEASTWLNEEGNKQSRDSSPLHCDNMTGFGSLHTYPEDFAMVGLDAMERANSTLEDFSRSYFMFHEMDAHEPQSIFRYLQLLSFTESYIYQIQYPIMALYATQTRALGTSLSSLLHTLLDTLNEKVLQLPTIGAPVLKRGSDLEANWSWIQKSTELLRSNPFRPLALLLEHRGLLTERIRDELKSGEEYWTLERKLCCAIMCRKEISVEDVMRAIHLKSFDYRVLNLLLYQLRKEKVNELHMEFLSVSEFLVEIADDLFDYEDDVLENNFNILRMFVKIYGASTAPIMLAKLITEAEERYDCLLKALDPKLSMNYRKRCEEATKEGGKVVGPSLGTWSIPPVIEDEDLYQSEFLLMMPPICPSGPMSSPT